MQGQPLSYAYVVTLFHERGCGTRHPRASCALRSSHRRGSRTSRPGPRPPGCRLTSWWPRDPPCWPPGSQGRPQRPAPW